MKTIFQITVAAALTAQLVSCATKNDAGIVLHKKPDLSKVTPGTPINKVAGLKKPIKREVITKGEMKGAEAWLYEWDEPGDEVNNKMFTSVVVKDGVIVGYAEDTPEKWRKDPKLHEAAKLASSWEDIGGHMAQAARWQAAADALAGRNARQVAQPRFDPVQAGAAMFANSYKPWENAQPVNYGMIGGGPVPYRGSQSTSITPTKVYPVLPNSGGLRDFSTMQPVGVVDQGKVYAVRPNSGGLRDYNRMQPVGVVEDGKMYPVLPNSGGLRDYNRMQPVGVIQQ